jgi:hypothetical protein
VDARGQLERGRRARDVFVISLKLCTALANYNPPVYFQVDRDQFIKGLAGVILQIFQAESGFFPILVLSAGGRRGGVEICITFAYGDVICLLTQI